MSGQEWDIEAIVREVLRRLAAMQPGSPAPVAVASETLVLSQRLITLAVLERKLDGVRRVRVPAKAVVTPAVKDELKQRKIELERA